MSDPAPTVVGATTGRSRWLGVGLILLGAAVGVLALRGHPAAPVLALAPSVLAVYTYTQLIVGNEYLRLPGNVERFFPLLLGIFILAGATAACAWGGVSAAALPALVALILAALSAYLYRPLLRRTTLPTPTPALIASAHR